jgi:hypothetical protein
MLCTETRHSLVMVIMLVNGESCYNASVGPRAMSNGQRDDQHLGQNCHYSNLTDITVIIKLKNQQLKNALMVGVFISL